MTIRRLRVSKALLGAAIFALAAGYLWWIAGDILEVAGDEGIYLEGGRRIVLGQQPYRDFFVLTGPLTFWIEAILAGFSGMNLPVMRLPLILDAAFLAWAVFWFTSRYINAVYSAGTALAFLVYESRIRLLNVNHRWDSGALATAAIMAALVAQRPGRRALWVLSGALSAAAAWATPSFLIVTLPLLLWSGRQSVRSALALVGGGMLITTTAALYLHSHGALLAMFESLRWTSANYTAANRVTYGSVWAGAAPDVAIWRYLMVTTMEMVPAVLPLAALAGWAWFWRAKDNRADASEILPLVAATAALTLAAWPRWTADTLLHTMAIPWFLCAVLFYRLATPRQRFWCCGAVLLIAATSLAGKVIAPLNYWPRETRVGRLRDPDREGELLEVLERRVQPGESLFSFPYLPSAYFYLNARNPTRYTFLQPGMMNQEDERRAIEELWADPPRWVIYEKFPAEAVFKIWPGSDPARIPMAAMNGYLTEHYRQVDEVTSPGGHVMVMQRVSPNP
jgi:hypothetical protein